MSTPAQTPEQALAHAVEAMHQAGAAVSVAAAQAEAELEAARPQEDDE